MLSRRALLTSAAALPLLSLAQPRPSFANPRNPGPVPKPTSGRTVRLELDVAERPQSLPCFGGRNLPLWTFSPDTPLPIVRMKLGDRLDTHLVNNLTRANEHVSIHWHGLRIPIDQDGVPYISQYPVAPGRSYDYSFVPPDTGSYLFHTHCNTAEQLGRGLAGLIIVEGDETEPYDHEEVLVYRDWHMSPDGTAPTFEPFLTDNGAANAGTFGKLRSVNFQVEPEIAVPAGADVRIRFYNVDPTRILELGLEGAEAAIIAVDGMAVTPFPLETWRMGSAMRIDLVVRTPADGGVATFMDYRTAGGAVLAHLKASGTPKRTQAFDPAPLAASRVAAPDLGNATTIAFELSSTAQGSLLAADAERFPGIDSLCLSQKTFWSINKTTWPETGHEKLPPPLAVLERGKSYIFEFSNISKQFHPIHFHGHSFTYLGSNKNNLPPHYTDTVLTVPRERARVAFVADNPGDWMLHCHVIEHQETGMMGYIRVL
ncbi:multicopper oxidase family protein [Oryzibacter oryziterrae]|uniref:multicopper oxidase family protein n=1 Tax=Oryzibacter oryziterrae TaxID=2766474 RepID=UPI001F1D6FBC|nr:multicopper oxidase family protein [Oryzibacter oryziterrae]